jgi:phage terminase large subunit-like protein
MEFHRLGISKRERCLMAANQSGKTFSAGCEVAYHATGHYPDWWEGRRFHHPIRAWFGCTSNEMTRDNPQRILLGPPGHWGEGTIPEKSILDIKRSRHTSEGVDIILVRHRSGGASQLTAKSYEQGREKWQGESLAFVWYDEEPPGDLYMEGLTRTNATGGMVFLTLTPLLGMTKVATFFYPNPTTEDRAIIPMTLEDCSYPDREGHYSKEQIAQIITSYPLHEREARAKGVPMLGSGRIFPVAESIISEEAFEVPSHWPVICGIDFGWDHPTAAVKLAWDRDDDVLYVTRAYRQSEAIPSLHCMTLRKWGTWMPWAWPADGLQTEKTSGDHLADLYRKEGLRMLREPAHFSPETMAANAKTRINSVEAGVTEMLDRMQTGRLKVFRHLEDWFEEFRHYHRKDGKIVKDNDDLLAATRYAMMMRRFSKTPNLRVDLPKKTRRYDPLGDRRREVR